VAGFGSGQACAQRGHQIDDLGAAGNRAVRLVGDDLLAGDFERLLSLVDSMLRARRTDDALA
jgi:hypothetical protein